MKILGIDPGTRLCGWAYIEDDEGEILPNWQSGVIDLRNHKGDIPSKLHVIFDELQKGIDRFQPEVLAAEAGYIGNNPKTSLVIGYARATCMLAAASKGIPYVEYLPTTIKRAVTSTGGADKRTVAVMVGAILGARGIIQEDQADALATAICHLNQTRSDLLMAAIRMNDGD